MRLSVLPASLAAGFLGLVLAAQPRAEVIFQGAGASPAAILTPVDAFRAALGALNPNNGPAFPNGRREINWDGVPDARSAPNALPGDFFSVNSPRGVEFSTPGTALQVSATAASGTPVEFGNLNPTYPDIFQTFSAQRLFTAIGSNIVDVSFLVPGTATPGLTRGFGAVFTDVDLADTTSLTFFGIGNSFLGNYFLAPASGGLSFLGVDFGSAAVSRVRITSGNAALGPNDGGALDIVVMDDFIYGEPVAARPTAVPEPASLALFAVGAWALAATRRGRTPHPAG
jgi:hypothetical protein